MAIRIILGKPRSGKTYYVVHHLVNTYFDESKTGFFKLKSKYKNIKIVSNIDELKLPHDDLDEWITLAGGVDILFSLDYQKKIHQKYPQIIYLIDEAQFKFPSSYKTTTTFNWLEYHGHLGQDIYFVTHSLISLPRQFYNLAELTMQALPRSTSFLRGKDLRYNVLESGEIIDKKIILKKKKIFKLYQSQNSEEVENAGNPFIKYFVAILLVCFFMGWRAYNNFFGDKVIPEAHAQVQTVQQVQETQVIQTAAAPPPETYIWQPVSYVTARNLLYIVFNNDLIELTDFPYQIKLGGINSMYAYIPVSDMKYFVSPDDEPQEPTFSQISDI